MSRKTEKSGDRRAVADTLAQDVERAHRLLGEIEAELERRHDSSA